MANPSLAGMLRDFQDAERLYASSGPSMTIFGGWYPMPTAPLHLWAGRLLDSQQRVNLPGFTIKTKSGALAEFRGWLLADSLDAGAAFCRVAANAGAAFPESFLSRYSFHETPEPAAVWIMILFDYLLSRKSPFITSYNRHWTIENPFLASVRLLEDLMAWQEQQAKAATPEQSDDEPQTIPPEQLKQKRVQLTRKELSDAAWVILREEPDLTMRQLAKKLGCAVGTVAKLTAWKATMEKRRKKAVPKPKATMTYSPAMDKFMEAADGKDKDKVLNDLVDDQRADWEPSPLERRAYTVRSHKKV